MSTEAERRIARDFVAARRSGGALVAYPGPIPQTLSAAYRIQDHAIALVGLPIGGWKVGRIAASLAARFGAERLAGPVFSRAIQHAAAGAAPAGCAFAGGYAAAEAEFLFEIGQAPPPMSWSPSAAELSALVTRVHVGIEIASSPFPGINDLGPAVTVSDFGNNNGLIIGPEVADWPRSALFEEPVSMSIGVKEAGRGHGNDIPGGPLSSVRFILEHLAARGIAVPPGTWISSGAVTGVHEVRIGERISARFGRALTVECVIEQARPY